VFDGKSALEQLHYHLLVRVMREYRIGEILETQNTRKLLYQTILATDMSVHNDFMTRFNNIIAGEETTEFDLKIIVCQAILKCADISNPVRKYFVLASNYRS
jgi:hypothetical protein